MKECIEARNGTLLDVYQRTKPMFNIKGVCHKDMFTDTEFNLILRVELNLTPDNIDFITRKINPFNGDGSFLIYAYYEDKELVSISLDYVNDGECTVIYSFGHGKDFDIVKEYCKAYVE